MATLYETSTHVLADRDFDRLFQRWETRGRLSDDEKRGVASLGWVRSSHGRESFLTREGDRPTTCKLLLHGFAYRQKSVNGGSRQIISVQMAGDLIDLESSMLEVADHNVQSLGRSTVASVAKASLLGLMARSPAIQRAIWLDVLVDASISREWIVNVGRRDARQRIAHFLCEIASRLRSSGLAYDQTYDFPLTQEQLADATGLTPVHTNRTLQGLRKDGLISLGMNKLTVLDWTGLTQAGDFDELYLHPHAPHTPHGRLNWARTPA